MATIETIDQRLLLDNKFNINTITTNKSLCNELTIKDLEEKVFKLNGEVLNAKIQNQKQTSEILSLKLKLERKNSIERELLNLIQAYRDEIDQLKKKLNLNEFLPNSPPKDDSITILEIDDVIHSPRPIEIETTSKNDENLMKIDFPFDLLSSFSSMPTGMINKGILKQNQSSDRSKIQNYLFKFTSKKFNLKTILRSIYKSKTKHYSIRMICRKLHCNFTFLIKINVQTKEALISYNGTLCKHQFKPNELESFNISNKSVDNTINDTLNCSISSDQIGYDLSNVDDGVEGDLLSSQLPQKLCPSANYSTDDDDEDKFEFNEKTMRKVFPFQDMHAAACDACLYPIFGNRYKCNECEDYDLCWLCRKEGYHKEHNFELKTRLSAMPNEEYDDHAYSQVRKIYAFTNLQNVVCDSCTGPIFGKRYNCQECEDYDLCQICKENGAHDDMSEHVFKVIKKVCKKKALTNDLYNENFEKLKMILPFNSLKNVVCDGCSGPIFGNRYKCETCSNYDLCHHCKTRGVHSDHSFYIEK